MIPKEISLHRNRGPRGVGSFSTASLCLFTLVRKAFSLYAIIFTRATVKD
jgi:hypothetical protein